VEGLKVGIYGLPNSGKTHFAMTAPRPIFMIDTEFGARLVAEKFDYKDEILIFEALQLDETTADVDPIRSLVEVEKAMRAIVKYVNDNPSVRGTIVIDSASDIWNWLGIWLEEEGAERFTKTGQIMRTEWGKANKRYMALIYKMLRSKWNVILTGKVQEVYSEKGEPTGMVKARWQKDTEHWLDIVMRADVRINPQTTQPVRTFTITKCRAWNLTGMLTNPTWSDLVQFIEERAKVKIV